MLHLDCNGKENKSISMELYIFGWSFFLFLIYFRKIQHYTPEICNFGGSIRCACGRQAERTSQRKTGKGCWDWLGTHVEPTQSAATLGKHRANVHLTLSSVVITSSLKPQVQVGLRLYFSYSGWSRGLNSILLCLFQTARTYCLKKWFFWLSQLFASMWVVPVDTTERIASNQPSNFKLLA